MRALALLPLLAGCDGLSWGPPEAEVSASGMLMSTSSAYAQLDSAAVTDDGEKFMAVMGGSTWCTFVTDDGYMEMDTTADTNVAVHDVYAYTPLVSTNKGLAFIDEAGNTTTYLELEGVVSAQFRNTGSAVYTRDGLLRWYDGDAIEDVVSVGSCSALDVDREGDIAWMACADGVVRSNGPDFKVFGDSATRVAWSDSEAMVVAVDSSYRTLTAMDDDGVELWSADAGAPVLDIVAVADRALFAAILEGSDGNEIALIDAGTGAIIDRLAVEGTHISAANHAARLVVLGGYTTSVFEVE
jgi:hypothetical protein